MYPISGQFATVAPYLRSDFWEYDPLYNAWSQKSNIINYYAVNESNTYSAATNNGGIIEARGFSVGGKGYFIGGRTRQNDGTIIYSGYFQEYNPVNDTWTDRAYALSSACDLVYCKAPATFTINGVAYVGSAQTSGCSSNNNAVYNVSRKWYRFDQNTMSFSSIPDYPGTLQVNPVGFGGKKVGFLIERNELWKYVDSTRTWTNTLGNYANNVYTNNQAAFTIGDYAYIGGGFRDASPYVNYGVASFYEYNMEQEKFSGAISSTNNVGATTWNIPWSSGLSEIAAFSIGNKGYFYGGVSGVNNAYQLSGALYEFTPQGSQKNIRVDLLVPSTLCKGSTFDIQATDYPCYTSYPSDNVFTAQLSDANGFFSNAFPTVIGTSTASSSYYSRITATIPSSTPPGSRYRIRVVASNPYTISYDNGNPITISDPGSAGTISHPYSVPYPSELASDTIKSVTLPANTVSIYSWKKSGNGTTWIDIPGSNQPYYVLPNYAQYTAQNDTAYRRYATLGCNATIYTDSVKLRVYSTSNGRLNGLIKGKVKTLGGSGVPGILITVQKTIALKGSPITKTYTATTNESGDYSVSGIFYGDQDAGDPSSVTFNITASKAGHVFKTPNPRTAVLSKVNIEALGIDFTDESTLTISGSIQQTCSDCETLFRSVDSLNGVTLSTSKNNINYTTTSGADGHGRYSFALTETGDYIITPSKTGHKFNPVQRTILLGSDNIGLIDFVDTTKYTISGALRAGGNQIIGSAQLEFTDTVPGRAVKFKKIVTTATDGSFSVKLPARKYKMKMLSFTPAGLGSDIGVNDLLTWFNTTLKDSNYVDIDSSNQTFNLIYHRPPVLVIDNLPDTSCGNYVVFKQEETKAFTVKIYEGAAFHNVLLGYDTVSVVKLNTAVHLVGIQPQLLNYRHVKGLAQVQLTGGSPNLLDDYYKPFRVNFEDKYSRKATELTRNVRVLGVNADPGTFTTVSPSVPVLILHAPPGDQSTSFWEQTQTTETAMRFSALTDKTTGTFQDVKIGASFSAGIGFVVETSVWANANQSMSNSQRVNKATEAILSSSTTVGYATEPNGGDVYVGGAMNLCYSVAHELKYLAGCQLGIQNSLAVAPKGFATTFTYSEGFLRETLIPSLQFIAENNPDSSSKYLDQIKVWEQVIANNNINKARAEFVRNRSFDGNAGPITESTTSSATQSSSIEFEVEIQKDKAISAGLEIGGAGFEGGASVSLKMTTGSSSTNTNTSSTTMGYTLDDDDAGDYYSVDIKKDPVYSTPVFVLVAGTSSCPAEPIAQSRDYAQLSIPTPELRNIPGNGEALFQLKLQNASQSRESRTYFLTFNQSSNPNGALVSIGGSPVTSNIAYTIPYMGSQLVTVSVKKSASSNVFSYEGLEFTLSDACDGGVATSSTISAFFQSPCSDLILNAPGNNWVAKLSNNNIMPVEFTGYNLTNLQSVALEYAHAGRGDWVTDTTIFQNFITNPTTTVLNWNIADIEDGSYDIRMKLNCASGSGYTQRLTGMIDREAPSLFGLAQPTDRSYVSGDEISMTYTENIETKNLNSNKVTLTRMLDGSNIPVQVSGYNNKLMVVPLLDLSTFASGEAIRLVSKYITDVYGNESAVADTFLFSVGATVATNANRKVYVSNVDLNKSAVLENSGDSLQVKFTISNSSAYNTAVNFIVSGSATFESDYGVTFSSRQNLTTQFNGTQGTINIPANTTSATLKIKPTGDDDLEGNESVIIRLLSGGDYKIGTDRLGRDSAIVVTDTIKNDDLNKPEILIGEIPTAYPTGYCIVLKDESFVKPYVWNVPTTLPAGYCATVINPALVRTFMEIKLPTTLPTGYCVALSPYDSYEKIYSVSLGTMKNSQNLKTECGNGYTDYTTSVLAPTLRVGEAVPFSVLSDQCVSNPYGSSPSGLSIFIDYNRDGDFDDVGEKAFTSNGYNPAPNNRAGFITIPTDASLGLTKMRVVVSEWDYSPSSCYYAYGEVEDYSVMLYGSNTDSATLPKGYCQAVVDTNLVRPIIINVPITEPEGYCDVVMDTTKTRSNKLPTGYCASTTLYNENEQIFAVSFGTMSNTQTDDCSKGYTDYSSTIAPAKVHLNERVPFSVNTGLCATSNNAWSGMAIYIDYNRDGDFNDPGEMAFNNFQAMYGANTRSSNVVIPSTATLGLTKMRVIVAQYNYAQNPCEQFSYGEVEDYAVMIEAAANSGLPTGYCKDFIVHEKYEHINSVSLGTMSNMQTEDCSKGYTDYSYTVTAPTLRLGEVVPFSVLSDQCVTNPPSGYSGMSIYIDYNRNGSFYDVGEQVYTTLGNSGITAAPNNRAGSITIPTNASLGMTLMRIVLTQNDLSPAPCYDVLGEVEDYAVMIEGPSATVMPNGYCYANASYMQDEQIFAVSFGTMNNTQTENCTTGFTDYSTTINAPVVRIGESIPFSVTTDECDGPTYFPSGLSIFIDYNRDGVFNDITEKVYTSNGVAMSPNTRSGSIIIPAGVSLGLTKMRVVISEGNGSPGSCGEFGYGEVEDYAVMIEGASSNGLPAGYCEAASTDHNFDQILGVGLGTMNNDQEGIDDFSKGYTDYSSSVTAPVVRQGQTVPFTVKKGLINGASNYQSGTSVYIDYNRDGDFDDLGERVYTTNGTTPSQGTLSGNIIIPATATLGLTKMRVVVSNWYWVPVSCGTNLGNGEVEDYAVMIEAPAAPTIFDDEQISSVSFGSMNNVQSDNASTNYTNFASTITAPIIRRGENVPFSVKTDEVDKDPYYGSGMSIFIDYNRDGDFNDEGEKAYATTQTTLSPNTRSGGIQIPANATLGLTKMRIVVADGVASPNSCGSFNYGEVEDYSVMIYDVLKVQTVFEDEQIDAVSFGTMNNVQTENSKTNYSDYSLLVKAPTVVMGQSIPFSVSTIEQDGAPYYASGMSIFIDYNRDGDFDDAGEKAYTSNGITVSPNTRSGNILIPTTATAGFTKMRLVVQDSVASPGSCITLGYGEVEDYSVIISPVVSIFNEEQISTVSFGTMNNVQTENCATNYTDYSSTVTAPIVTTGTSVPFSVATTECDNAPYYASGMSIFIDYNRDGDFEDPGEKAYTTDGITVSPNTRSGNINIPENATLGLTKMRVVVQDSVASPNSCITLGYGEVEDYAIMIHNVPPVYTILDDEQIKAVSFGTLTNVQTDNCSSNYTDYSSTMAAASVTLGQSVPFSVLTDECDNAPYYASGMSIFIDYNRDGDYNDAGEKAYTTNGTQISPNTRTGRIIIPANATPGLTKMRIVVAEGVSSPEACTPMGYGEVEDYGVMIKIADSATICNVGNVILSASDKIDGLSVATYQWKLGTNVVGTTRTISVNQPGAYSLKVFATNGYSSVALPMIVKDGVSRTTETIRAFASYIWHDVTYTQSTTTATWKGVNAAGCDSIVTLNLTILPACEPIFKEVNIVACNSYTWHGMKFTKTISGVEWTTTNSLGCDSTEVLNLVIKPATTKTSNVTVCSNQLPYQWNGVNYSTAGTYTKVLLNAAGCDSTDKLVLTIKSPTTSNTYLSICPAQLPFTWNGLTFNSGGTYTKTLVNVAGCDSTATLYLSIKANTTSTTRMAVCSNQFPITWNGVSYSTPGTYTAHFTNAAGCDSSANLELTQKLTSSFTEVIEAVGEYSWHGTTYTSSTNTPTWKGVNAVGCDSIVTLNLTILTQCITTDTSLYVTACNSYTFKGIKLYNSTVLDWVGVNRYGCDSIITLNLTIIKPVSTISVTGNTSLCMGDSVKLSANAGSTYLWSNGKTTQDIFVSTAGQYTVKVTDVSGCFATSAIKTVTVNSLPTAIISASGTTTFCAGGSVTLQANVGTGLTYLWTPGNATTSSIDVTSSGNYTVRVTNANGCSVSSQATSVTVNEMPTATISYASQLCATGIASVTQTGQTGGVYSAGQGLSINAASGEINLGASTPGNYVVKYTFSNVNCSSEATANITISPMLTPSVIIQSNATNNAICAGTEVVFTALGTNGGNAPNYQWKLNNNNVGTNGNTYTNASLSNGDIVTVVMTSNAAPCLTVATVSSNEITTTVNANSSATVNIASSDLDNTICAGTSVVFTANSTNGGASPVYQWKLNNVNVGTNNYQYSNASLTSTDVVKVVMTSNQAGCLIGSPATSNGITTTVNANLPTTVSIASSATNNAIGAGTSVTFTATPINGGLNPTYQWKLNNVNVGYNTSQYANNALLNADSVKVIMTASADACSSGPTAVSNSIVTTVTNQLMVPTITANGPLTFCEGESVVLTASGGNSRYATSVLSFSSQYDECGFDFSSCQILGQPDTYPLYTNEIGTAWSPLEEDNANGEFIELGYDAATASPINFIDIYETFGAGSIVNVKVKNPSTGQFVSVYTATAASVGDVSRKLHITFPLTTFPVNAIRIEMNTAAVAGFNNLDAVAIGKDVVGHTYLWSNGATTQEIVANTSGEYTVTVSDNMGQSKTSTVTLVTVKAKPTAVLSIVGSSTICSGTNASLSIAITNNSKGPWSGVLSDGTPFSGSVSPIIVPVSPASAEDYSISSLNAGSCSAIPSGLTGTQTVTVVEIPTAEISGTPEICKGTPANLSISITGYGSGPWTGTLSDGTQFGGSVSPILVPLSPSSTTTYHIVSLAGAYCSATSLGDEATITVNELPTAAISYVSPVCATGIASVNQTGTLGGVYSSTTGLAIDAETGDINLDGSEAGTYLITYTFSDGVCSNSTTASITINVLPTATISYPSDLCPIGTAIVTRTGTAGGTYSSGVGLVIDANTGLIDLASSVPDSYVVTYSFRVGGCDNSATTTITIHKLPVATISYAPAYCPTGTALVVLEGQTGGTFSSSTGLVIDANTGSITLESSTPGTYEVAYLFSDGYCSNTVKTFVTIYEAPVAEISYGATPYCKTGIASVTQTGTTDGVYSSTAGLVINANTGEVDLAASAPGTYNVRYEFTNGNCGNVATASIVINALSSKPTITASGPTTFCAGGNVTLTASDANSYLWNTGETTKSITVGSAGTYSVKVQKESNCNSDTTQVLVVVNPLPVVPAIAGANGVCIGSTTLFTNTKANGTWTSASPLVATVSATGVVTGLASGISVISYTVVENGCSTIVTKSITVNVLPAAPAATGATICGSGSVTLTATAPTRGTVAWYDVATLGTPLATTTSYVTPVLTASKTYYVEGKTTSTGCVSSTRTVVEVLITSGPTAPSVTASGRCSAGTVQLTATPPTGATVAWFSSTTSTTVLSTANSYTTPSISVSTTYYVESRTAATCVSARVPVVATIASTPATPTLPVNGSVCGSGVVTLKATAPAGVTVDWYDAATGGTLLQSGTVAGVNSYTTTSLSATKLYYAQARNILAGCLSVSRLTVTATVNALPAAPAATGATRCGPGALLLTSTAPSGGSVAWYDVEFGGTALATTTSYTTASISATKIYYVASRITATGCVSATRTVVTATITATPEPPTASDVSRCGTGPLILTATPPTGATVAWFAAATGGTALSTANPYTTASISTTRSYYVESRFGTTCVSTSRTAVLATINPIPAAPTGVTGTRCGPGSVTISASTAVVGASIEWYATNTSTTILGTGNSFNTPSITANTTYYAAARSSAGCLSARTSVAATISPLLAASASITGTTAVCPIVGTTTTTNYTAAIVTNATSYKWTVPAGAVITSALTGRTITVRFITVATGDAITVQGVASNGCAGNPKTLALSITACATPVLLSSANTNKIKAVPVVETLTVKVFPNPSNTLFNLNVTSSSTEKVQVRMMDARGSILKTVTINPSNTLRIGEELRPGVYMFEVRQGGNTKVVKAIKF
jgi:hypothetical protein